MKRLRLFAAACTGAAMLLVLASSAAAQTAPSKPPEAPEVTLRISVVISRWEGEKKVANAPYVLMVVPSSGIRANQGVDGDQTTIQMGSDYPIPAGTIIDGKPTAGVTYRSLGTNITSAARPVADGRFVVYISVHDSQIDQPKNSNQPWPSFQTFRSANRLTMRDGQTTQYTVATDPISGQVVKLDVTMNVAK